MLADHLTTVTVDQLADAVRAVLAGHDHVAVAAAAGLSPADLDDAARAYHAAGTAALEQHAAGRWYHVRVRFTDWKAAEQAMATGLGPQLDELAADGTAACWWFLRKHRHWRLRLLGYDTQAVERLLCEQAIAGRIAGWQPAIYEPEAVAFGGPVGIDAAHDLFCADSHGVLDYLRRDAPPLGRREISVLLISAMLTAARLDQFERGDVFARVAALRPPAPDASTAPPSRRLTTQLQTLLAAPAMAQAPVFAPAGPAAFAAPWLTAFEHAGHRLSDAAARGVLGRGLRAVLAHAVIFHWNRLGLPATTQATLARTAAAACLPPA